jgi:hypothetical protein
MPKEYLNKIQLKRQIQRCIGEIKWTKNEKKEYKKLLVEMEERKKAKWEDLSIEERFKKAKEEWFDKQEEERQAKFKKIRQELKVEEPRESLE